MSHLCDVDVLAPCIDEQGLIATGLLATTRCVSKEPKLGMRVWRGFAPQASHSVLAKLTDQALPPAGEDIVRPASI
jgi:hypothetical protein